MNKQFLHDRVLLQAALALLGVVAGAWMAYGLFGKGLIESAYREESFAFVNEMFKGRSTTPLESYHNAAIRFLWLLTLVLPSFLAAAAVVKARLVGKLVLTAGAFMFTSFVLFCALEIYPSMIAPLGLNRIIEYYAHKELLRPHETLVYVYRDNTSRFGTTQFKGDSYSVAYGAGAPTLEFRWWDRQDGFVITGHGSRADVVVFGDSYMDIGQNYEDTFGARLSRNSGLNVTSMGAGGYGPFQYLEMFKLRGVRIRPSYAIFSFFEGNDISDVHNYIDWKQGGGGYYYRFDRSWAPPLWQRYFYVLSEFARYLGSVTVSGAEALIATLRSGQGYVHPELVVLNLRGWERRLLFSYKNDLNPPGEMLETEEWLALGRILQEFKDIAESHGIEPIILYIPVAAHIYAEFATEQSGAEWRRIERQQISAKDNIEQAMTELARRLDLRIVSLTPVFLAAAAQGRLLYYSFDSHWNSEGREVAAAFLARALEKDKPHSAEPRADSNGSLGSARRGRSGMPVGLRPEAEEQSR